MSVSRISLSSRLNEITITKGDLKFEKKLDTRRFIMENKNRHKKIYFKSREHRLYMKYIRNMKEDPMFYASYGSFMHKLLEEYYKGKLPKDEMPLKFLLGFSKEVQGARPAEKIVSKYIAAGSNYLKSFEPLQYNPAAIEKNLSLTQTESLSRDFLFIWAKRRRVLHSGQKVKRSETAKQQKEADS